MRIAYLSTSTIPSFSANSIHVMKMCNAFAENGHQVTLHARRESMKVDDDFNYYGVANHFNIAKSHKGSIPRIAEVTSGLGIARKAKQLPRPNLFYARDRYSLFVLSRLGIPMIFEAHGPPKHIIHRMIEKTIFTKPHFKRLVVISDALKELLKDKNHLPKAKTVVLPDAADLPTIQESFSAHTGNRLQIGYLGSLYTGRGIEVIIQLADKFPEYDFHIVGGTKNEINKHTKRIPPSANLTFKEQIAPFECPAFLSRMDVLLAPYQRSVAIVGNKYDTARWMSPLKIFEYMASGKAIIASDLPVLREILDDGVNAMMVDPEDLAQWVRSLKSLKENALRNKLGSNALKKVAETYTWKKRAENVLMGLEI